MKYRQLKQNREADRGNVIGGAKTAQGKPGVLTLPDQDGTLAVTVIIWTPVRQDSTTAKYTNNSKIA